jgi:hypothetical protein
VDCTAEENKPPICDDALSTGKIRAVLAEATSIEAYLAPRVDLWRAQKNGSTHAQLYFSPRFGFIALADAPRVYQNFHVGVGLMAEDSVFEGSVFEIGWGNNELLSGKAWKRLKIDGYLSVNLDKVPWFGDKGNFFIQMFIDNDLGESSADSIQTFMGFNFDFRKLSGR